MNFFAANNKRLTQSSDLNLHSIIYSIEKPDPQAPINSYAV